MSRTLFAAFAVVSGAFGALFPRRVIDPLKRLLLAGYENPEDLEPSDWYVEAVRVQSALTALAGLLALTIDRRRGTEEEADEESASDAAA
ncbi:hypothetical protein [Salarchaeum japonicum]|uniref:DUF6199 domain-containing protein n=1 Tax=Salarchaeum japonicum TaxID=555573 RepID=A0AAV3T1R9_9EURY|nr:hypothetical protein [Salarchaeum japonicum]